MIPKYFSLMQQSLVRLFFLLLHKTSFYISLYRYFTQKTKKKLLYIYIYMTLWAEDVLNNAIFCPRVSIQRMSAQ